jgi:hypothetical protein
MPLQRSKQLHRLHDSELSELADTLAIQIHALLGPRVYRLTRGDVVDLIAPYVDDLLPADQSDVAWLVWHLFQDAREMQMGAHEH